MDKPNIKKGTMYDLSVYLSKPVTPLKSDPFAKWEDKKKTIFPSLYKHGLSCR